MPLEEGAALRQQNEMRADVPDVVEPSRRAAQKRDADADEGLAHDAAGPIAATGGGCRPRVRRSSCRPAAWPVRQRPVCTAAIASSKVAAGQGRMIGTRVDAGFVGIGAELPLEGDGGHGGDSPMRCFVPSHLLSLARDMRNHIDDRDRENRERFRNGGAEEMEHDGHDDHTDRAAPAAARCSCSCWAPGRAKRLYHVGVESHGDEEHAEGYAIEVASGGSRRRGPRARSAVRGGLRCGLRRGGRRSLAAMRLLPPARRLERDRTASRRRRRRASMPRWRASPIPTRLPRSRGRGRPRRSAHFIENPKEYAPGTKMSYRGMADIEDRANLIAYLEIAELTRLAARSRRARTSARGPCARVHDRSRVASCRRTLAQGREHEVHDQTVRDRSHGLVAAPAAFAQEAADTTPDHGISTFPGGELKYGPGVRASRLREPRRAQGRRDQRLGRSAPSTASTPTRRRAAPSPCPPPPTSRLLSCTADEIGSAIA